MIIADPDFPQEIAVDLVQTCHQRGITVHVAPTTMEILFDRAEFSPGEWVPLFTLRPPVFDGIQFIVKRTFDLVGAAIVYRGAVAAAADVRAGGPDQLPGPDHLPLDATGIGGQAFACLKFRTAARRHRSSPRTSSRHSTNGGAPCSRSATTRVIAVGRLLRRFSLDELPRS